MNNFEKQLNNLPKSRLSRRADFSIRYKLMLAGLKQNFSGLNFNFFASTRLRPVLAAVVILVLVFSGTASVYAYNSEQVTRASLLYPVKRGIEQIESRFATTPAAQVRFHNKLAGRRITEAQFLSFSVDATPADQNASSSGEGSAFKLKYEDEFNDTLQDADNEIDQANEKAGKISDRAELDRSLTLLSGSHLNDLDKIKNMAEGVGLEADDRTTDNIVSVLDNIRDHQQRIVRAISQFDGDLNKAGQDQDENGREGENASSSEINTNTETSASTTATEAANSLNRVRNEIKNMEAELSQNRRISNKQIKRLTERLNKKINQAESAIGAGDLNKFNGLLRATEALTNNGQHFLRENQPETKPAEIPPVKNEGEKIKGQYDQNQIHQKQDEERKRQEELRKKLEEQRKQEEEKNYEQSQLNINTTTTGDQTSATSSVNNLLGSKDGADSDTSGSGTSGDDNERTASSTSEKRD
jgi:hypothetical protein